MEVVNSTTAEGPDSGAAIWHQQLNRGLRITGIGGSDDHAAGSGQPGSGVGTPTTVVYAERLSELAILNGIRAGHVYIKPRGPVGPDVYLTAQDAAGHRYMMGDTVPLSATVDVVVEVKGGRGQRLEVIRRGEIDASLSRVVGSDEYREQLPITPSRATGCASTCATRRGSQSSPIRCTSVTRHASSREQRFDSSYLIGGNEGTALLRWPAAASRRGIRGLQSRAQLSPTDDAVSVVVGRCMSVTASPSVRGRWLP